MSHVRLRLYLASDRPGTPSNTRVYYKDAELAPSVAVVYDDAVLSPKNGFVVMRKGERWRRSAAMQLPLAAIMPVAAVS